MSLSFQLLRRAATLPPRQALRILGRRLRFRLDASALPALAAGVDEAGLSRRIGGTTVDDALARIADSPLFFRPETVDKDSFSGGRKRAEAVHARTVDLLGSGPVALGTPIDWARDFKSGIAWPMDPMDRIAVNRLGEPCDIKVPWELSRLQWLFPAAQAWRAERDDRDAALVRTVIEDWIDGNPVARGPNWVCTMDVALRGVSLVWLTVQCLDAPSWTDPGFRFRLVKALWLHGHFVSRHLEWSDVNGNHLLADALGLVVIGAALPGPAAARWHTDGWALIRDQIARQVHADGGTFEASSAYHRFVLEMLVVAAAVRTAAGHSLEPDVADRLVRMADFLTALLRTDGSVPNWGDADDGRVLPFGERPVETHGAIAAAAYRVAGIPKAPPGPPDVEAVYWLSGAHDAGSASAVTSTGFPETGAFVLRGGDDHVFVDAGAVGMNGRGGHGHNDCLSFEAMLDGVSLVVDPGTYVYTADPAARNRFRSTGAHNGPMIDGQEANRLVSPDLLWMLRDDATPRIWAFEPDDHGGLLIASHDAYGRLADPVRPRRAVLLDTRRHALCVIDDIDAAGPHTVVTRLTMAPGVSVTGLSEGAVGLDADGRSFVLRWQGEGWSQRIEPAPVSPSYGRVTESNAVVFSCQVSGPTRLAFGIAPNLEAAAAVLDSLNARI